jgi:hypothetical protein
MFDGYGLAVPLSGMKIGAGLKKKAGVHVGVKLGVAVAVAVGVVVGVGVGVGVAHGVSEYR